MSKRSSAVCAMAILMASLFGGLTGTAFAKPLQAPDLTLTPDDISFSDDSPVVGQTITVWAKVHNIGDILAYNVPVYFYDNATSIGVAVLSLVEPNIPRSTYTLWTPSRAGLTNITVVIDPFNLINESNENNNAAWRDINVLEPLLPDLYVMGISFSNDRPKAGESITIHALVKNAGRVEAKDVVAAFIDNNTEFSYDIVSSIGPNQSFIMSVTWVAKANVGDASTPRVIEVFVDPEDRIDEISESNNTFTKIIFVGRPLLPDLSVVPGDIYLSTSNPVGNETVTVYAKVSNLGVVSASVVLVAYFVDSKWIGNDVLDSVPGQLSSTASIQWSAVSGFHTMTVRVDPNATIQEPDRSNNVANKSVVIDEYLPQLSFANISCSASMVLENMTVTMYADVANTGRDVAYGLVVRFYDVRGSSENEIGWQFLDKVSPGAQRRAFVQWFASPSGNHTVVARADAEYSAGEFNRTHAEANATIFVWPSLPDLQVLSISIYPMPEIEGKIARVNATIRNHGVVEATNANAVLINNGDVVASFVFTLSADRTGVSRTNISFNYTAKPGVRELTVFLDPQNKIREYDETDNSMPMVITVPARPVALNLYVIGMVVVILLLLAMITFIWRERIQSHVTGALAWALALVLDVPLLRRMVDEVAIRAKWQKR